MGTLTTDCHRPPAGAIRAYVDTAVIIGGNAYFAENIAWGHGGKNLIEKGVMECWALLLLGLSIAGNLVSE